MLTSGASCLLQLIASGHVRNALTILCFSETTEKYDKRKHVIQQLLSEQSGG